MRGAYFPHLHWDTDWKQFPGCDGFQLWYFVENDDPDGEGNMFMARTDELSPDDDPVELFLNPGGSVSKNALHPSEANPHAKVELKRYASLDECALSFEYLACDPGDLLIFSKRTLHMSDPRPHLREHADVRRLALNMRVIVRAASCRTTSSRRSSATALGSISTRHDGWSQ